MKRVLLTTILLCAVMLAAAKSLCSPNGKLNLVQTSEGYLVQYGKQTALEIVAVGYGGDAVGKLKFAGRVNTDYQMLSGKRLHCTNQANEYRAEIAAGQWLVVRLYNDGVAFRYELRGLQRQRLPEEQTAYRIPTGIRRWMMRWSDGYEGFYPLATESRNQRWAFPALLQPAENTFVLLTEAGIEHYRSAASLHSEGERFRVIPDKNELTLSGDWTSPWRVAIIGSLADVVESTLVTDVAPPCELQDVSWIKPGVVSWVYWAYNHGSNDCNIIAKYVDLAVALKLPYVLIDAEWDEMKDGKTVEDAVSYAKSKGIRPMIWYNSSVGWLNGAPGPKFRLNKPEDREREFSWCERIGVAGVKVDFFSGDNQLNMDYCLDLMESAARHHLLINFHGATIPRGWQRTWPNLLTTEAVYGAEWYNNVPTFTDRAARHNATLPFTRNVIGPMDYTPCAFSDSQHPHITTHAHELALTVLYESGLQHLADRPESFLAQPAEVQQFLSQLPAVWDETRFISGYPGESVVLARRSGDTWYVAGINGLDTPQTVSLQGAGLNSGKMTLFADGPSQQSPWSISQETSLPTSLSLLPRGGFVCVINK